MVKQVLIRLITLKKGATFIFMINAVNAAYTDSNNYNSFIVELGNEL